MAHARRPGEDLGARTGHPARKRKLCGRMVPRSRGSGRPGPGAPLCVPRHRYDLPSGAPGQHSRNSGIRL